MKNFKIKAYKNNSSELDYLRKMKDLIKHSSFHSLENQFLDLAIRHETIVRRKDILSAAVKNIAITGN